ncbi:hypothetical protein ACFW1A_23990 [Kitasatospora sp. NPDC058965]|uniref:hypothetical protein n=1 Tax=Kitasatospora sp. NPDC058965 TaxID=3346682 RepID=UPI0036B5144A
MSTNRSGRIDRDAAERLLAGPAVGAQGGHGALAELLAAAAGPATAAELTGEEAATAAYREAVRLGPAATGAAAVPASRVRRVVSRRRPRARLLGARAAVAALAVTALGSVAVAAGTGHLPEVLGGSPQHSAPDASSTATTGSPTGSARPTARATGPAALRTAPGDTASLDAALLPLCRQWHDGDNDPRFEPLTRAANGSNRVADLCAELERAAAGDQTPDGQSTQNGAGRTDPPGKGNQDHSATPVPGNGATKSDPTGGHGKPSPTPDPSKTKGGNHPSPSGGQSDPAAAG